MAEIRIDPQALAAFIRSSDGPIFRRTFELAQRVEDLARQRVGVSRDTFFSPGIETSSQNPGGHLRDAIVKRVEQTPRGFRILVGVFGALAQRAIFHHEGTRPHVIRARHLTARGQPGFLRFFWPKVGRIVYAREVHHPGTRPNPFLRSSLEDVMRTI